MEDDQIIRLYWRRSEEAIAETAVKYGIYCKSIAYGILRNSEDTEECVTDTYLRAWNVIPPQKPKSLSAFLGKITRNLALSRYRKNTAKFRGGNQVKLAFEELNQAIPSPVSIDSITEEKELIHTLEAFLWSLSKEKRQVFLLRYWYFRSLKEISVQLQLSESKVRSMLYRMRKDLKTHLEREGIYL